MGAEEGFDDDVAEFRPPPPLDDRLWRHPAEAASLATTGAPAPVSGAGIGAGGRTDGAASGAGRSGRRSPWAVGLVSVVGSAVLAGSLMFTAGGIGDEPQRFGLRPFASLVPAGDGDGGIVTVEVDARSGPRTASGMVLADGVHVLTSLQLTPEPAADAPEPLIRIIDDRGQSHAGSVVARDTLNDLAVIRADGVALTPYAMGSGARLATGDAVDILGGGLGVGLRSWSAAVERAAGAYHGANVDHVGVALLDAPLPAAAGGAVAVDEAGMFVGLVSVDLRPGTSATATSLAAVIVPAHRIRHVAAQFLATGEITHAWMGIEAATPTSDATLSVSRRTGAVVDEVVDGSPAGEAGLQPGDVILRVCEEAVMSIDDVVAMLLESSPGTRCGVEVNRGGRPWHTEVEFGERAA